MRKFGLIGGALGHSFSPGYFAEKFAREGITDARYDAYELGEIAEVEQLLHDPEMVGFNVTIPYKRAILTYLTAIDPEAEAIGAVNTVHLTPEGPVGFNTDVTGFRDSLKPVLRSHHQRALILGTGGASAAVWHVLRHLGLQCIYVSRTPEGPDQVHYQDLRAEALDHFKLIVNTTPVGQHPDTSSRPDIPYEGIGKQHILMDLIYNPETTAFMQAGLDQGAAVLNGLRMLHGQAEAAWDIWNR